MHHKDLGMHGDRAYGNLDTYCPCQIMEDMGAIAAVLMGTSSRHDFSNLFFFIKVHLLLLIFSFNKCRIKDFFSVLNIIYENIYF